MSQGDITLHATAWELRAQCRLCAHVSEGVASYPAATHEHRRDLIEKLQKAGWHMREGWMVCPTCITSFMPKPSGTRPPTEKQFCTCGANGDYAPPTVPDPKMAWRHVRSCPHHFVLA